MPNLPRANSQSDMQCEAAYTSIKASIDNVLAAKKPLEVADLIRLLEASQRIHWQLIKYKSKLSQTLQSGSALRKKIGEFQAKDGVSDKRFTRGNTLDKLKDL